MNQDEKVLIKEAYAYTPGLKVKKITTITKSRRLPIIGDVLVKKGDEVDFETVVARTEVPGESYVVRVAHSLGIQPEELSLFMIKSEGDKIKKGTPIAKTSALFGLIKNVVESPIEGVIESISTVTGQVIMREPPVPVEINAYIPGRVVRVIPKEGVIIEKEAAFIQGVFGMGGEAHGELFILNKNPDDVLIKDMINSSHKGKIIVGGCFITIEALKKAIEEKVTGVIVGGIDLDGLMNFLGYKIGVAITGEEDIGITFVITEGFGKMNMSNRSFNLLKSFDKLEAAINGATQIRAGVIRPEVIIPHKNKTLDNDVKEVLIGGMKPGTPVRIIREPFFGKIGTILSLPVELRELESESKVRIIKVVLENGEQVIVPRANVEIIEE